MNLDSATSSLGVAAASAAAAVPSSPIAVVGTLTLLAAYAVAGYCLAAGIAGNARKNRRLVASAVYGLYAFAGLVGLSAALIIYAFITHDFAIKYVAATSDTSMATWYKITSFWGGLDGSLLFWVVILALFSTIAIKVNSKRHRDMIGYFVATVMGVQLFFLSLLVFTKNPFATSLAMAPVDGQGLNPLLQNYWMIIHPPSLYIGLVSATIPFAFGIAALASGRLDDLWLGSVRVWVMICFFFLSFGLILGGRWAYEELGWGGYWAWDPVENAGLIPWFLATAFLHSAVIQEQRGMMKKWNLMLVIMTFFMTIYGTFMTRSGVVQSVHAFGEDNVLALQFIVFMALILVVSFGLLIYRAPKLASVGKFESFASREFAFLLNNWILLACAGFVVTFTMYPTISEAVDGQRRAIGPEFFNLFMTPTALILLFLAGAAPLLAWRKTTQERLNDQFKFPAIVSAATVVLLGVLVPTSRTTTAVFAKTLKLPMPLICYGLIAFVAASIGQEFWRGVGVRRRQSGSDPFSSLLGLVLSKRRKYGGYVVHLGIAVMMLGFSGKAYEGMIDRTIEKPMTLNRDGSYAEPLTPNHPSSFTYRGYQFVYENLTQSSDDNKVAVTAQLSVYATGKDRERLATLYPARWDFQRGEQPTTEVAIKTRFSEDVYTVLTGYDLDSGLANFRIYVNPLITWVWVGFMMLALGTFICLIPQKLVDLLSPRPRSRLGRAADVAGVVGLVVVAILVVWSGRHVQMVPRGATIAEQAITTTSGPARPTAALAPVGAGAAGGGVLAIAAAAGAEHDDGMGMGDGTGYAHTYRPDTATAESLMKELICLCGGCQRENIYECKCGAAADKRKHVLELLGNYDLTTDAGQQKAYDGVVAQFVREAGGEHVLSTPRGKGSWLFPTMAVVGGLGLLFAVGRTWVGRGQREAAAAAAVATTETADYADRLDDELASSD